MSSPVLLFTLILGIVPAAVITVFLHEAGHVLAGRLLGYRISSWGLGSAPPLLFCCHLLGAPFYFTGTRPLQGITWAIPPVLFPPRHHSLILYGAGMAVNFCMAVFLALLWLFPPFPLPGALAVLIALLLFFNAIVALANALPVTTTISSRTLLISDGGHILALLRSRGIHRRAQSPASLLGLRPLWEAVGDSDILHNSLLMATAHCLGWGDTLLARRYFDQAVSVVSYGKRASPPGFASFVESVLLESEERAEAAEAKYREANQEFADAGEVDGIFLTELHQIQRISPRDLLDMPLPPSLSRNYALATELAACKVLAAARIDVPSDLLETLLSRYRAARAWYRADTGDLDVFSAAAMWYVRHGEDGSAAVAYEEALTAAQSIFIALSPDNEAQSRFSERIRQTLARDAAMCLCRLKREAEADHISTLFPTPEELVAKYAKKSSEEASHREAEKVRHDAIIINWSSGWTVLNTLLTGVALITSIVFPPPSHLATMVDGTERVLAIATAIAAALCITALLMRRFLRSGIFPRLSAALSVLILLFNAVATSAATIQFGVLLDARR